MLRPILLFPIAAIILAGCLRNDGVVDPDDNRNKTVLSHFQGVAIKQADSDFNSERLFAFENPRIALVWEFFGAKVQGSAFGRTEVSVDPPYRFSLDMTGPPPEEVALSKEPVLGHFWLYSDRNGNGVFDRLQHPSVVQGVKAVDALRDAWVKVEDSLATVSKVLVDPIFQTDTFYVDKDGSFLHLRKGRLDTLYRSGGSDSATWSEARFRRFRILRNYNNWENFFALRKKTNMVNERFDPVEGHASRIITSDWVRLVPLPGKEEEFEKYLQRATLLYMYRFYTLQTLLEDSEDNRWDDWPYNVDTVPGHDPADDWLVGRGRYYHVAYFPDGVSLETAIHAESGGSFQVKDRQKLHRGYNVLKCDNQYRCEVLGADEDIIVDLGQTEEYFNPPDVPLVFPIQNLAPKASPEKDLKRFEGSWKYIPFAEDDSHVFSAVVGGDLWVDIPRLGLFRLVQADSLLFYLPGRDVQVEFVLDPEGTPYKLLLYHSRNRTVCTPGGPGGKPSDIRARAEREMARERKRLPDSVVAALSQPFLRGKDTLTVSAANGSDTFTVRHARAVPQVFLGSRDGKAYGLNTGDHFELLRNEEGTVTGLFLVEGDTGRIIPSLAYVPRLAKDLFPAPAAPESLVSSSGGSAKDTYAGHGGKKRYGCAADGNYLKEGDGWVRSLRKGQTGDPISLRWNGDALTLRLAGLAGRRARVVLRACREKGALEDGRRFLVSARGFRDGDAGGDLLEDDHFVEVSQAGDTLSFGPFPVPSDAYDVELRRASTLDSAFYFALDGYKVYAE